MARKEKSDQFASLKTVQSTRANGSSRKTRKIEEEFKFGQTEADTMASGEMAWPMDKEDLYTPKVMSMKENGLMTKPMGLESTLTSTEVVTKVNGTKISNTALELSSGQMVLNMKVNMNKV